MSLFIGGFSYACDREEEVCPVQIFQFWIFPSVHAWKYCFNRVIIRDSLQASFFSEGSTAHSRNWNYWILIKEFLGQSTGKSSKVEVAVDGELPPGGTSGCSTHQ